MTLFLFSRLYQMSKLYIFGSSCGLYSCPLAMTDGAAKVLETMFPDVAADGGVMGNAYRFVMFVCYNFCSNLLNLCHAAEI